MPEPTPTFTPQDAAQTLADLPDYEQRLTLRTAGLTWLVWALAIPAIFLTYNTATPWLETTNLQWLNAILWIPWIAAAAATSHALWQTHAITLNQDYQPTRDWLATAAFTLAFFLLAGALLLTGLNLTINTTMLLVTGLLTQLIAVIQRIREDVPTTPTLTAGALIILTALALSTLNLAQEPTALIAAATTGLAYAGIGTYYLVHG